MIVVADTTPLLYLSRIGRLEILRAVHGEVVVPETVWNAALVAATRARRGWSCVWAPSSSGGPWGAEDGLQGGGGQDAEGPSVEGGLLRGQDLGLELRGQGTEPGGELLQQEACMSLQAPLRAPLHAPLRSDLPRLGSAQP